MRTAIVLAITLILAPLTVLAQSEQALVERYTSLAGSEANAKALVTGLREGSDIHLAFGGSNITIDPPTGKMGNGNVNIALALTQASLKDTAQPTAQQFRAALMNVLQKRADGAGWGQISQSLGFKLGEVVRSDRSERVAHADRPDKPDRPARPDRPDRASRR